MFPPSPSPPPPPVAVPPIATPPVALPPVAAPPVAAPPVAVPPIVVPPVAPPPAAVPPVTAPPAATPPAATPPVTAPPTAAPPAAVPPVAAPPVAPAPSSSSESWAPHPASRRSRLSGAMGAIRDTARSSEGRARVECGPVAPRAREWPQRARSVARSRALSPATARSRSPAYQTRRAVLSRLPAGGQPSCPASGRAQASRDEGDGGGSSDVAERAPPGQALPREQRAGGARSLRLHVTRGEQRR